MDVVRHLPEEVRVTALAAHSNIDLLEAQIREFHPDVAAVYEPSAAKALRRRMPNCEILEGPQGLNAVAAHHNADFVVSAVVGTAGLAPTLAAIEARKDVGLANKEVLIAAGALVTSLARKNKINLIPIDSEHSALFQCLLGEERGAIRRLILTASGGPFRAHTDEQLQKVSVEDALRHPTWNMGPKVTIDSSTLMNKGLEIIEAYWLFGVSPDRIDVVIHPQSIIHSMVEFQDGSIKAQMNVPDMINPIQYALTYPRRLCGRFPPYDFTKYSSLTFSSPDTRRFRCLRLAYQALRAGGTLPCFMNAANEVLVNRFLKKEIPWHAIAHQLEGLMEKHQPIMNPDLRTILEVDAQARQEAQ